jgi:hypothetical protein
MVWSPIKLGYFGDSRLDPETNWINTYQRFDICKVIFPKGWPYDSATSCFSNNSCHMGAPKAQKALVAFPVDKRSEAVKRTIESGVEYFFIHNVYKRNQDLKHVSKSG